MAVAVVAVVAVVVVVVVVVATATATAVAAMLTAMAAGAEHVVEVSAHPFDGVPVYFSTWQRDLLLWVYYYAGSATVDRNDGWDFGLGFASRPGPRLAERRGPPHPIPTVPPQVRDVRPPPGAQAWVSPKPE